MKSEGRSLYSMSRSAALIAALLCSSTLLESCLTGTTTTSQSSSPVSMGDASLLYVSKQGDTMTGALNLPTDGLVAGTTQLVLSGGDVGIGTAAPGALLDVNGSALIDGLTVGQGGGEVSGNIAFGIGALNANTTGADNTALGYLSMTSNTTASNNTAVGDGSLEDNTTGTSNTAIGYNSLLHNTSGNNNSAFGSQALYQNTTGVSNTAVGMNALENNTIGSDNTAVGISSQLTRVSGTQNTSFGSQSLYTANGGNANTAIGYQALYDVTTGATNTAIGDNAGRGITTGSGNTIIGSATGLAGGLTNHIIIADGAGNQRIVVDNTGKVGIGVSSPGTMLQVAGEVSPSVTNTYSLGDASLLWSAVYAQNGTIQTSDARKKKDIQSCDLGLDFINSLRPVSYRWKSGPDNDLHYGLIAQETEKAIEKAKAQEGKKVTPDDQVIISHDKKSDVYGMKYSELISPIIKAIQQISERLSGHGRELAALKIENSQIRTQHAELLKLVCEDHASARLCKGK